LGMRKLFDFAVPSDGLWSLGNGFGIRHLWICFVWFSLFLLIA
jgi:hypothetical protein